MDTKSAVASNRTPMARNTEGVATPSRSLAATTRALLTCGAVAGPLYVAVGAIEMLIRPGFDLRKHSLSLLSNGDWGWIHSSLFVGTGLLTIAGAAGLRRALYPGCGATWGPPLVGLFGLGLLADGFFRADPALGFPPGTPLDATAVSTHGLLHLACGGVGFLGLIAACCVFARRFVAAGERGWAAYSATTGVLFFAAFFGIATGSQQGGATRAFVNLAFTAAVVLGWSWVSAMAARPLIRSCAARA